MDDKTDMIDIDKFRHLINTLKTFENQLGFVLPASESLVGSDLWKLHLSILKLEQKYDPDA